MKFSRRALARYAADQLLAGQTATKLAKRLAAQLTESKRTAEAEFLVSDIAWELEQRKALSIGKITTAHPLSKALAAALKARLKRATLAREILLEENIDKSVLGGLKVETAGRVWDSSVARKLAELKEPY